jgi:hypothetical protein
MAANFIEWARRLRFRRRLRSAPVTEAETLLLTSLAIAVDGLVLVDGTLKTCEADFDAVARCGDAQTVAASTARCKRDRAEVERLTQALAHIVRSFRERFSDAKELN